MKINFDIRACELSDIRHLFIHHGYKSIGKLKTYCFAVFENSTPAAAFIWSPPPLGCASSVCPECSSAVLSLSRMVALPKTDRALKHISKPLKFQMHHLIDRGRWPVLVTYSDKSLGHTGFVYQCSGWEKTKISYVAYYNNDDGQRKSRYSDGQNVSAKLNYAGKTELQRWEHWSCPRGFAGIVMAQNGWKKVPILGKTWASGNQAYKWVNNAL